YNMGDYFAHWLAMGARPGRRPPKIFHVNWFRRDSASGRFLWPGFGDNSRVLEWICRRCDGEAEAEEAPTGLVPPEGALRLDGLDLPPADLRALLRVDAAAARAELGQVEAHLARFGDRLPPALRTQFERERARLGA